jgi:hypothetical protein
MEEQRKCKNCRYFTKGSGNLGYCYCLDMSTVSNKHSCTFYEQTDKGANRNGRNSAGGNTSYDRTSNK